MENATRDKLRVTQKTMRRPRHHAELSVPHAGRLHFLQRGDPRPQLGVSTCYHHSINLDIPFGFAC